MKVQPVNPLKMVKHDPTKAGLMPVKLPLIVDQENFMRFLETGKGQFLNVKA